MDRSGFRVTTSLRSRSAIAVDGDLPDVALPHDALDHDLDLGRGDELHEQKPDARFGCLRKALIREINERN